MTTQRTDAEKVQAIKDILRSATHKWSIDSVVAQATRMLDEISDVVGGF